MFHLLCGLSGPSRAKLTHAALPCLKFASAAAMCWRFSARTLCWGYLRKARQGHSRALPARPQNTSERELRDPTMAVRSFHTVFCACCILFGSLYHPKHAHYELQRRPQEGRVARIQGQPASPKGHAAMAIITLHGPTPKTARSDLQRPLEEDL
jgi:hypothetical protein